MNPPSDVGKRPLPNGVRARFTEMRVDEVKKKNFEIFILIFIFVFFFSLNQIKI